MNLSGTQTFDESNETVWDFLHDPDILSSVIPGCESLTLNEDEEYEVVMKLGIAAVKGEYTGKVKIEDVEKPSHYILYAEGSGNPGHVTIKLDCWFTEKQDGTLLEWECDAEVGGKIASVGGRVLGGVAKYLADKFFKDLKKKMKKVESNETF